MRGVGSGDLASRRFAVEQAVSEASLLAASARETAAKDSRMWATLGWLGGGALALILI